MRTVEIATLAQLGEYFSTVTTPVIASAMKADVRDHLMPGFEDAEFTLTRYLLAARARATGMDALTIQSSALRYPEDRESLSYIVKLAHHFSEPTTSQRASDHCLGPRWIATDGNHFCEELIQDRDTWRAKAGALDEGTAKSLGTSVAKKLLLMFELNLIHRFDDFQEHTFILHSQARTDVRWIDWAKELSVRSAGNMRSFLVEAHVQTVIEALRHVSHGALAYSAFRVAIMKGDSRQAELAQALESAERHLTAPDSKFFQAWRTFLDAVG